MFMPTDFFVIASELCMASEWKSTYFYVSQELFIATLVATARTKDVLRMFLNVSSSVIFYKFISRSQIKVSN